MQERLCCEESCNSQAGLDRAKKELLQKRLGAFPLSDQERCKLVVQQDLSKHMHAEQL